MSKEFAIIGDSLTKCNPIKIIDNYKVSNFGISGNETVDLLNRINHINFLKYTDVILLIGTNDLLRNHKKMIERTIDEVFENTKLILDKIRMQNRSIKLHLQSIYPVSKNSKYVLENEVSLINQLIKSLNNKLKELCIKTNINYLDVHQLLIMCNILNPKYTYDGIHINEEGYNKINEFIETNI
jgi:lysophospholipase L1-like esterase